MQVDGSERRIHLLDLSTVGAQCFCTNSPEAGTHVTIHCGPLVRPAKVAWAQGQRFGLMFHEPVDESTISTMIASE